MKINASAVYEKHIQNYDQILLLCVCVEARGILTILNVLQKLEIKSMLLLNNYLSSNILLM
jgi:hypothetical protein